MQTRDELRNDVEAAAARLGANRLTVLKWRSRGIPTEWQIKLFEHNRRKFPFNELARLHPDHIEASDGAAA